MGWGAGRVLARTYRWRQWGPAGRPPAWSPASVGATRVVQPLATPHRFRTWHSRDWRGGFVLEQPVLICAAVGQSQGLGWALGLAPPAMCPATARTQASRGCRHPVPAHPGGRCTLLQSSQGTGCVCCCTHCILWAALGGGVASCSHCPVVAGPLPSPTPTPHPLGCELAAAPHRPCLCP